MSNTSQSVADRDERRREGRAHTGGLIAAGVVAVLGVVLVLVPAFSHLSSIWEDPFKPRRVQDVVVTSSSSGESTSEVTEREEGSLAERALANGGLLLLRVGIVVIAAFLAGAFVQRAMLGRFDVTLGPISLPDVKRVALQSEKVLDDLKEQLEAQKETTKAIAANAAVALEELEERVDSLEVPVAGLLTAYAELFDTGEGEDVGEEPPPT